MQVHKTRVFPLFPFIVLIVKFTMSTKGAARPLLHSRIEQLPKAFFADKRRPKLADAASQAIVLVQDYAPAKKWVSPPRQILE